MESVADHSFLFWMVHLRNNACLSFYTLHDIHQHFVLSYIKSIAAEEEMHWAFPNWKWMGSPWRPRPQWTLIMLSQWQFLLLLLAYKIAWYVVNKPCGAGAAGCRTIPSDKESSVGSRCFYSSDNFCNVGHKIKVFEWLQLYTHTHIYVYIYINICMSFLTRDMVNLPAHDEPTRWLWWTNPRVGLVRQV